MSSDERLRPGGDASGDGSDAERDAWLRAALRHAPDAEAAPPPALRESILAQARTAAQATSPVAQGPRSLGFVDYLAAFWAWLARPPVAAGFASVMAATLVGMLWWDRPIDETLPQAPPFQSAPRAAKEPAETVSPTAAPAPAAVGEAQQEERRREQRATTPSAQPPATVAPAATVVPTVPSALARLPVPKAAPPAPPEAFAQPTGPADAEKAREAAKRESSARLSDRAPTPAADVTSPATVDSLDARGAAREERKDRAAIGGVAKPDASGRPAPAAPSFSPTPAPAPAPIPAPTVVTQAAPAPKPAPVPFPAERRRDAMSDALRATPPAAPAPSSLSSPAPVVTAPALEQAELAALAKKTAPARDNATANQLAGRIAAPRDTSRDASANEADPLRQTASPEALDASVRPMARSLSALASEGSRWGRALPGGGDAAVDAPLRAWLADVQASSRRWERRGEQPLGGAKADANTLLLRRDGRPVLLLRLDDGGVFFESASGDAWFAPLAPDALARLRASLPPASR